MELRLFIILTMRLVVVKNMLMVLLLLLMLLKTIVDEDGNSWQFVDTTLPVDGSFDGLYMNGDISTTPISIVDNGDGTVTITNDSPTTELNIASDGDIFTFTTK